MKTVNIRGEDIDVTNEAYCIRDMLEEILNELKRATNGR